MNIEIIIFDFDGVLVESVDVKGDAFVALYGNEAEDIQNAVLDYHNTHGGVTRFDKIRYYEETLCHRALSEERLQQRAQEFSDIVEQKVVESEWVMGAQELLEQLHETVPLYIASATPHEELLRITQKRKMEHYFKGIFGAPEKKATHILTALSTHNIPGSQAVMIGDAMSDYEAAQQTGTHFIGRKLQDREPPFPDGTIIIKDLTELETALKTL